MKYKIKINVDVKGKIDKVSVTKKRTSASACSLKNEAATIYHVIDSNFVTLPYQFQLTGCIYPAQVIADIPS